VRTSKRKGGRDKRMGWNRWCLIVTDELMNETIIGSVYSGWGLAQGFDEFSIYEALHFLSLLDLISGSLKFRGGPV
jgi:hypothetical protein